MTVPTDEAMITCQSFLTGILLLSKIGALSCINENLRGDVGGVFRRSSRYKKQKNLVKILFQN